MDIQLLEKDIHRQKTLQTKENFDLLVNHYLERYNQSSPKEKYKLKDKLSDYIESAALCENTAEALSAYIQLFQKIKAEPKFSAKTISRYVQLITGGEPKKIAGKQGTYSVESGTLTLSDPSFNSFSQVGNDVDKILIEAINIGQAFVWGTGGDGTYDIILRLIDSPIPVANPKEYRFITDSSPVAIIKVTTGSVAISDMGLDAKESPLKLEVPNGNYKVQVYAKQFIEKFEGYVIVLCPTLDPATNTFSEIASLQ